MDDARDKHGLSVYAPPLTAAVLEASLLLAPDSNSFVDHRDHRDSST